MAIAHIVFSIGKTASTALSRSWVTSGMKTPVFHTHDMKWFAVIDEHESVLYKYIRNNYKENLFGVFESVHCPGKLEYRFNLDSNFKISDIFQHYDSIEVIGSVRNPVLRRMSQFFESLTVEGLNSSIDSHRINSNHLEDTKGPDMISNISEMRKEFIKKEPCGILKEVVNYIADNKKFLPTVKVIEMFVKYFIGVNIAEYTKYFGIINDVFKVRFNMKKLNEFGYSTVESMYDSKPVKLMVLKMEDMKHLQASIYTQTGIKTVSKDRIMNNSVHLFDEDIMVVKERIIDDMEYNERCIYSSDSHEYALIKSMNYDIMM